MRGNLDVFPVIWCCSVTQSCPMDYSMPRFPVLHLLLELADFARLFQKHKPWGTSTDCKALDPRWLPVKPFSLMSHGHHNVFEWTNCISTPAAAAAKSLQSCPTLCNPIDGSPSGSTIPGILQARTLERVAISFSNAWKGKVKVKSLSRVRLLATPWTAAYQAYPSMGFSRQEYWSGVPLPSPRRSNYLWIGLWQIMEDYTYPLVNLFLPGDSKLL